MSIHTLTAVSFQNVGNGRQLNKFCVSSAAPVVFYPSGAQVPVHPHQLFEFHFNFVLCRIAGPRAAQSVRPLAHEASRTFW
jgi:hypothetical protein